MRLTSEDLPEPVPPMTPMVGPRRTRKLRPDSDSRARAAIAQRDIFEHDCVLCSGIILSGLARERHTRILVKHAFDAAGAGSRLRDRNDQVRELDELDQDLESYS